MDGLANWLGQLLGDLPTWLFWPAFVVVVVISTVLFFWYVAGESVLTIKPGADNIFDRLFRSKKRGKK